MEALGEGAKVLVAVTLEVTDVSETSDGGFMASRATLAAHDETGAFSLCGTDGTDEEEEVAATPVVVAATAVAAVVVVVAAAVATTAVAVDVNVAAPAGEDLLFCCDCFSDASTAPVGDFCS